MDADTVKGKDQGNSISVPSVGRQDESEVLRNEGDAIEDCNNQNGRGAMFLEED